MAVSCVERWVLSGRAGLSRVALSWLRSVLEAGANEIAKMAYNLDRTDLRANKYIK
jgi:hypothetical protein